MRHRVFGLLGLLLILGAYALVEHQQGHINAQQRTLNAQQAQINRVVGSVAASQASQLANRAANVGVWCSAINASRSYAKFLRAKSHQTPYRLALLDCKQLEMNTVQSAKP